MLLINTFVCMYIFTNRPSVIIARGRMCVVGTSHGNLYALTRDGVSITVDKLMKSHNVIFGIVFSPFHLISIFLLLGVKVCVNLISLCPTTCDVVTHI